MNIKLWEEIEKDFERAKAGLEGKDYDNPNQDKSVKNWQKNEEKGKYYLHKIFYIAKNEEEKHPLIYARILVFIECKFSYYLSIGTRLNEYIKPALEYYKKAKEEGYVFDEGEIKSAQSTYDDLKYEFDALDNIEFAKKYIKNAEKYEFFPFYDGHPVRFEHTTNEAFLDIDFDDDIYRFYFKGVVSVEIRDMDLLNNYIFGFDCYPIKSGYLKFGMQDYNIWCEEIILTKLDKNEQ